MRGRKPKPTALKILSGNPGRRKLNKREPRPPKGVPVCPTWLDDDAKKEWYSLASGLESVLTEVDQAKLACLCQAIADVKRNTETIRKRGEDVTTPAGMIQSHPAVSRKNQAMKIVAKLGSDFGIDPSSRSRLVVPDGKPVDEMEEFLNDHTHDLRAAG